MLEIVAGVKQSRYTPLRYVAGYRHNGKKIMCKWECECECGQIFQAQAVALREGRQVSCGCHQRRRAAETCRSRGHTREVAEQVTSDYLSGLPAAKVAQKHNIHLASVLRHVRRLGKQVRPFTDSNRRYPINHDAFAAVTDESAYWVGFLIADGCVSDEGVVSLKIASVDHEHLELFRQFLGGGPPVWVGQKGVSAIAISCPKIVSDLAMLGVTPRKTFTAELPPRLIGNIHAMRGLVDGDGCLSWHKSGPRNRIPHIGICGTHSICSSFSSMAEKLVPGNPITVRPHATIWQSRFTGIRAAAFTALLYASGTALARKQKLASEFAEYALRNSR